MSSVGSFCAATMGHMDILKGLNPQQLSAVKHDQGGMLVVAGAGTGKTQVITRRIAHLIEHGSAKPGEILALTFTEKAAREMADRLYELIGWQSFQVPVMTFNAFGAELLGRFASHVGRSTRGGLLNTTQKTLLLQQHFQDIQLQYYGPQNNLYEFLERIVDYIGRLQNVGVTAERYAEFVASLKPGEDWQHNDILEQQDLSTLYTLYERVKAITGTYDYSDQLAVPLAILRERPNLAERLRHQYHYVLVDEYQDTSPIQDALLRTFVKPGDNIFAVGDDDQAIYGFRGADIANIMNFAAHFKVEKPQVLIENYRSGQSILDAAYRLIQHNNPNRLEVKLGLNKQLKAQTTEAAVGFESYRTAADEQSSVIEALSQRIESGASPSSLAVLARSNAVLRSYAQGLRAQRIPFSLSTEVNIFEQREVIHLWYLLEWLGGRVSPEAMMHVVLGPFVGWKVAEYQPVVERMKADLSSPEATLRALAESPGGRAAELIELLDTWRKWAAELRISQLAYKLVFETGLADQLVKQAERSDRVTQVFEDLRLLLEQMQDYETVALDPTLAGYLAAFPKPPALEAAEALGETDGVQLLTVHAAKGLEFDSVYVVGCSARVWSERSASGLEVPAELKPEIAELAPEHEQRRLMYVAITRAKRTLQLSAATETAGGQRQAISPLITELLGHEPVIPARVVEVANVEKTMRKLQQFYPLKDQMGDHRLSFETSDGWLELSVGALDSYKRCPHEFYLQYVLGISQPFGPQLAFGTALHGAFQAYYEAKLRHEPVEVEQLSRRLDELWSDRGYDSRALAEAAHARAQATLASFVDREEATARHILGTELPITLELPDAKLRLRGRIDAYFQLSDGVEIRDFKTGIRRDADKLKAEAKDNFQLRTYAVAYENLTGQAPAAVTLDYVVTGVEGSALLTSRILSNHRTKLTELADRIRQHDFAPAPESDFHHCPAFQFYGPEEDTNEPA